VKLKYLAAAAVIAALAVPAAALAQPQATVAPSTSKLAHTYLAIVAPVNRAIDRWDASNAPTKTTGQTARVDSPLIAAITRADNRLLRVHWSPRAAADIRSMVKADGAVIADLAIDIQGVQAFSVDDLDSRFVRDLQQVGTAANIVRADLGLPPYSR
jgi:hypothetical protein